MNQKFNILSQVIPSSPSTGTDFSQSLSPIRFDSQDLINLNETQGSLSTLSKLFSDDSSVDFAKCDPKPIFKIIKENKQQSKNSLDGECGNYNRKDKSLGELSRKLLVMFGKFDECSISLDGVTQQLGVERRRIYDIINILESLGVVSRQRKNCYQWKGLKSIRETLTKLQQEDLKNDSLCNDDSDGEDNQQTQTKAKREKSLGLLSTGFIKLFFFWKKTISLEEAGRKLSSDNIEENKIRTKIRRLYDIANVLSSLGLIRKTCLDTKKPAYEWIGLIGLEAFMSRLNNFSDEGKIFLEAASKKKGKSVSVAKENKPIGKPSQDISRACGAVSSNTIDTLLSALLDLYKNPTQKSEEKNQFDFCSQPTNSLKSFTPYVKKSVSIIQRANVEDNLNSLGDGFFCKPQKLISHNAINLSSGFKRSLTSQDLNAYDEKPTKKVCSFNRFISENLLA